LWLLAASGRFWPLLAASGRFWPLLAASGRFWPLLAASGCFSLLILMIADANLKVQMMQLGTFSEAYCEAL